MSNRETTPDHQALLREALASRPAEPRAPAPPTPESLAPLFPELTIDGLLGSGGMGAVYRAVQTKLGRVVALKVLRAELAEDPEFGARFLREAQALARLEHPHILAVHDFGERGGLCYLVTEHVDGVNLRQLMELDRLSPTEALRIAPQICQALQFAHERGVVHRDIKPENILVDVHGTVKLADFGLAKVSRPGDPLALTRTTAVMGTPHYMAPEQWRASAAVDHRADIFSLGVVLYEMLTGQLPLGHYDPPSEHARVPRGLDEVVRRTLAQQPEKRYQSAKDVERDVRAQAQELDAVGAPRSEEVTSEPVASGKVASRPAAPRSQRRLTGAILGALAGAALVAWLAMGAEARAADEGAAVAAHLALLDAIQVSVARGEPWLGSLPEGTAPSGPAAHLWLAKAGRLTAGALTLVALIFGLWSRRNLRNRAHPFTAFDVGVATLVPLGALTAVLAAPLLLIRAHDLRTALLFVTLLGFCGVATWGVRAELHWLRTPTNRTALSTVRHRGAAWLILGLTTMVWVSVAQTAVRMSIATAELPTLRPAAAFVGQSAAAVLTALGPPEAISCSTSSQEWTYRTTKAEPIVALTLSGDQVVAGSADVAPLVPRLAELRSPYLGERAGDAARKLQLGAPVTVAQGPATEFTYADGLVLTVHAGRIVGISKR